MYFTQQWHQNVPTVTLNFKHLWGSAPDLCAEKELRCLSPTPILFPTLKILASHAHNPSPWRLALSNPCPIIKKSCVLRA